MRNLDLTAFNRAALALSLVAGVATALPAAAQDKPTGGGLGSVVHCDAEGGKQEAGAVLGGVLGAVAGRALAKNEKTAGTAVGAVGGAAAGSWVGCKMQRDRAAKEQAENDAAGYGKVYTSDGRKLASYVKPARYEKANGRWIARSTVNLRSAPSTTSSTVGKLVSGQDFQAMGKVMNSDWILVGRNNVGVGYVKAAYVAPSA
jgi:outer membrane lipoprotein SlyB